VAESEPIVGKINGPLQHRHLPTLRKIEKLIGCCQGNMGQYVRSW